LHESNDESGTRVVQPAASLPRSGADVPSTNNNNGSYGTLIVTDNFPTPANTLVPDLLPPPPVRHRIQQDNDQHQHAEIRAKLTDEEVSLWFI
jgi:hypothetical protein